VKQKKEKEKKIRLAQEYLREEKKFYFTFVGGWREEHWKNLVPPCELNCLINGFL
jgi:hypothetical protein